MVTRSILRPVLRPVTRAVTFYDGGFNPRSLFYAGEQGIWLDPSDFSTLFQDSAGTTPVTAVGQPVGLALDKRLGLALGAELVGAYDFTTWVAVGSPSPITANSFTTAASGGVALNTLLTPNRWYTFEIDIENTSAVGIYHGSNNNYGVVAGGRRVIRFKGWCDLTTALYFRNAAAGTTTIHSISVREIAGNHSYQTTSASRPTLQQDSNGLYYLSFDGTDDGMATPSINFTGTDKMTVWTGVRKLSDAATGTIVELSASSTANTNHGSFGIFGPRSAAVNEYGFALCGTTVTGFNVTPFVAPITNVLSVAYDLAGAARADEVKPRVNSAIPTLTGADSINAGTGNYGNYPLYIGRRGGTTFPFNGRIYQLIVRGAASSDGQIAAGEAWCNGKTRAY